MAHYQPEGWPTVIPRIFAEDVAGVIDFLRSVFNADGEMRIGAPSELRIGDSMIMVSDGGGAREMRPAFLYVYVENVDEIYLRALECGAVSIEAPTNMAYGDRRATVCDPWDNIWQIATRCSM